MNGSAEILRNWFIKAVEAVGALVDECDGALHTTLAELQDTCTRNNAELAQCPQQVWDHVTCALKPHGDMCSTWADDDDINNGVIVIYDLGIYDDDAESARANAMPLQALVAVS